jgi:hypothetical protein
MMMFDVAHLFAVFGGPVGVLALLDKYQPETGLTYSTVQMWQQRRQIPSRWMGLVLYIIGQERHKVAEFLTDPDELS